MTRRDLSVDLVVIGAGSGGLSVASGAAQLGLSVVLFERGEMGGDCLNTGCVPSKALLAAARRAHVFRDSARFGVAAAEPTVDWNGVKEHLRRAIDTIAPIDSQERFEGLGVTVIREHARFAGKDAVESDSVRAKAKRIVVATGGQPLIPDIPGLKECPHFTNESIFSAPEFPRRLLILGGGPIGAELGQAFRRLGAEVTIIEAGGLLSRFDPEAVEIVAGALRSEGVNVRTHAKAVGVSRSPEGVRVEIESGGARETIEGSHLLIAVGRRAVLDGLELEKGGVARSKTGLDVSEKLRSTSNPKVWAVGDAAGREQLTHAAGWHASVFVRNALFKSSTTAGGAPMPAAVYTDPEIAQVGMSEAEAWEKYGERQRAVTAHFAHNDRAQAEGDSRGFLKVLVGPKAKILGASAIGEGAADHLQMIVFAMAQGLSLRALTGYVAPYPTRGEINKRVASQYYAPVLFSGPTRLLVSLLKRIP
jgi:pyruvate/2-oxoglutarate dehydrogenase complex dihydrolipoamide dehydrogenase (E3) component